MCDDHHIFNNIVIHFPPQMLLCVGTFFSVGDDCKTQWQKLINGELKGEYVHMWSSKCV